MDDRAKGKFGRKIKARRIELGLKREQLAVKMGLTRDQIARIEQGKQIPPIDIGLKLGTVLGINIPRVLAQLDSEEDHAVNVGP